MKTDAPDDKSVTEVVDFADRLGKPAQVKELVLHVAELEAELKRTGTIEISERTLDFIADRPIRTTLETKMQSGPFKLNLNEQSLPILLRSALLEAYLHEQLARALGTMDEIDISLNEHQHKIVEEPIGDELRKQVERYIQAATEEGMDPNVITKLKAVLDEIDLHAATGVIPFSLYQKILGDRSFFDSPLSAETTTPNDTTAALATLPNHGLQAAHLGGGTQLQTMMASVARATPRSNDVMREAQSKDSMRHMFASPQTIKEHRVRSYTGAWYQQLAPHLQRFVNDIVLRNIEDALCINKAQTLFPGAIPPEVAARFLFSSLFSGILSGGGTGIKSNDGRTYTLDVDPAKSISAVAVAMQSVLDRMQQTSGHHALAVVDGATDDIAANDRRSQQFSLFNMFGGGTESDDLAHTHAPITAHTLWEYLDIDEDTDAQRRLYEAFVRAHQSAYIGTADDEGFEELVMRLSSDGNIICRINNTAFGNDEEPEDWGLFEAVHPSDGYDGADYARTHFFTPNIPPFVESLREEDASFEPLLARARLIDESACITVDTSILRGHAPEVRARILGIRRKLEVLKSFVTPEKEKWLSLLGLKDIPTDPAAVNRAFRQRMTEGRLHPDLHAHSEADALKAATALCELTLARNELLRCITPTPSATSVSTFLGRPLELIKD